MGEENIIKPTKLRIGVVSDSHNFNSNKWGVQKCDVIIHCGDFSFRGDESEVSQFFKDAKNAMIEAEASYFLLTPGNHEKKIETNQYLFKQQCKDNDIICLINERIEIEGVKFYGTPYQNHFCDWGFNVKDSNRLTEYYKMIPDDTDVLITHVPPKGILDYSPMCGSVGSPELWTRIQPMLGKLKVHTFGHIHWARGEREFMGTRFINAAILDDNYNLNPEESRMIIVDL